MDKRSVVGLIIPLFLTGCSLIPPTIVNEINMAQGVGYDVASKNRIKETIVFPIFKKDKSSSTEIKASVGRSSKEIRAILNNETRYPLLSGQLRLALYGKELSKRGINDFVDTLNRDPSIGNLVQLAIVDGDSFDLLSTDKLKTENTSLFIHELLEQNMKSGQLTRSNLHSFLFQFSQIGQDPYLPLIKKEKDTIKINGLAIFKDDRFVTALSMDDLFIFKGLVDTYNHGLHQFILSNGEKVVLDILHSNAKYKVKIVKGRPVFTIYLKMNTRLQEFSSPKKQRVPIDKPKLQKGVEQILEKGSLKIVNRFQDHQVDPLGLGAKYKEHYRKFNEKSWNLIYPQVKVLVHAKVEIKQTGIVE
ncbi:Ger(x)C family spore germination protein [Neobacillus sp. PS2-9]|uniref:Ger(x)C family spore germination protein n=1 Tax=Neobacillus sp. PS2-9 TaxID=3070676 RepID=UPI0027E1C99A|nr:Ger(x)C family spore germination protein [Neobacillus sp. PS2-9]WML57108.1 Ger(x)C family spore germination protein [Neobacillus sp. PS2-9]